MKNNYKKDSKKIREIISMIHERLFLDPEKDIVHYRELLTLSEKTRNIYGSALAHINLAQYYQITNNLELYHYHCEHAQKIANRNGYFDVMVEYYNLKGFEYLDLDDDATALSSYLKGVEIAGEINDSIFTAIFYNNIAEIFYDTCEYDAAASFYIKSYNALDGVKKEKAIVYRKTALVNLVGTFYLKKDVDNALKYYEMASNIECDAGYLPAAFIYSFVKVLILTNKRQEAMSELNKLLVLLQKDEAVNSIMAQVYLEVFDLSLTLSQKEIAKWCMNALTALEQALSAKIKLQVQVLIIKYFNLFEEDREGLYQDFYEIAIESEKINKKSMIESISSSISLYEISKKQKVIQNVRNNLEVIAELDELTKVLNRRYYNKILSKFIHDTDVNTIACMMIDIDHFKEFNDRYGHRDGDRVLVEVANILKDNMINDSYLARFGGDEFSAIFINHSDEDIISYIENVQRLLKDKNIEHIKDNELKRLSLSIGFYNAARVNTNEKLLIKKADDALYVAKNNGRNTYSSYSEE